MKGSSLPIIRCKLDLMAEPFSKTEMPPPARPSFQTASLFLLRKPAVRRWPFALRAAVSMGAPVAIGWMLGDISAGMMATIGGFTAVYGNDRPFLNRAIHLGCIAAALAMVVCIGVVSASVPWLAVPVITLIAVIAAFLCSALKVGPPGAYLFTLACAAGTAMGASHLSWWHVGTLVFAGGGLAWLLHMSAAIVAPRGPEILALRTAGKAVEAFLKAAGTSGQDIARHQAALALHQSWTTLVGQQPVQPRPDGTLSRLRAEGRELHMIFAEAINAMAAGRAIEPAVIERVQSITAQPDAAVDATDPGHVPLGRVSGWQLLREGLKPGSQPFEIGICVALASAICGLLGWAVNLDHAYWATATAVLMLHQGLDWATTLQRGIQRVGGTLVGLLVAGAILGLHPAGLWIAVTMMALQFTIEILVLRNYGLAVIFITAAALTIASGGHPVDNVLHLLWTRAEDTVIGCVVGLGVFALMARREATSALSRELFRTWAAIDATTRFLEAGDAISPEARTARRNLQHHTILLLQSFDASVGNSPENRIVAEPFWPAIMATQRLAYRLLSTAWQIEAASADGGNVALARQLFGEDGAYQLHVTLADIINAVRNGIAPPPAPAAPPFLRTEIELLSNSIVTPSRPA
jgi:uncharacterized membrane protein YccC